MDRLWWMSLVAHSFWNSTSLSLVVQTLFESTEKILPKNHYVWTDFSLARQSALSFNRPGKNFTESWILCDTQNSHTWLTGEWKWRDFDAPWCFRQHHFRLVSIDETIFEKPDYIKWALPICDLDCFVSQEPERALWSHDILWEDNRKYMALLHKYLSVTVGIHTKLQEIKHLIC